MAVYRFRVSFEDYEDVVREIEIRSEQTFADFHEIIQQSIQFDGAKPSSFFISNDFWIKGKEISSAPNNKSNGSAVKLMKDAKLSNYIADPHQKIYYVVDPANPWTFHIELVKIIMQPDMKMVFPRIAKITGDAPKQFINPIPPPDAGDEDFAEIVDEPAEETDAVEAVDESELGEGMDTAVEEVEAADGEEEFGDAEVSGNEEEEA